MFVSDKTSAVIMVMMSVLRTSLHAVKVKSGPNIKYTITCLIQIIFQPIYVRRYFGSRASNERNNPSKHSPQWRSFSFTTPWYKYPKELEMGKINRQSLKCSFKLHITFQLSRGQLEIEVLATLEQR